MDLMNAVSLATQTVSLVKQIKDLDKALDEALFKSQLIELHEAILDIKAALLEAKSSIFERDEKIQVLERELKAAKSGELCPLCRTGSLEVVQVREHPTFGALGHQERTLKCNNTSCDHREARRHDPSGNS